MNTFPGRQSLMGVAKGTQGSSPGNSEAVTHLLESSLTEEVNQENDRAGTKSSS